MILSLMVLLHRVGYVNWSQRKLYAAWCQKWQGHQSRFWEPTVAAAADWILFSTLSLYSSPLTQRRSWLAMTNSTSVTSEYAFQVVVYRILTSLEFDTALDTEEDTATSFWNSSFEQTATVATPTIPTTGTIAWSRKKVSISSLEHDKGTSK